MNSLEKNNIPAGYKDSAVGIIPQEWEVKYLGDLLTRLANGLTYDVSVTSGYPVSRIETISSGEINYSKVGYIDNVAGCESYKMQYGDILYSHINSLAHVGKVAYYDGKQELYHGMNLLLMRVNNKVDSNYLYAYLLTSQAKHIAQVIAKPAVNQASISTSDIRKIKLAVPPLTEQRKIAEILGVWDETIEKQSRLIERLELRKRGLMQRLLSGRTRLPGFTAPWQKVKLGEIGQFDKGTGVPKEKIVSEGCKAITYGEIYTKYDYVIKNFASYIDSDTAQTSKQISSGAILFAGSGETLEDIGKCVAFIDNDKAYAGGDIIIFNPTIEVDSLVLSYILNFPIAIAQKRRYGQGHSVVHIYQKDLARIEFKLPSLPEQKAIAEVLTTADDEIATYRKKLDALRLQKRGLMQQLLTGKTRVKI